MTKADRKKKDDSGVPRAGEVAPALGEDVETKNPRKRPMAAGKKASPAASKAAKSSDQEKRASEIPKFDLAEKVLAEQRRATAGRRKSPGSKGRAADKEPGAASADRAAESTSASSEEEQVISEIVSRDIRRLCGGDASRT